MNLKNIPELGKLGLSFIVSVLVLRILFLNESWATVFKASLTGYWMFVIPGIGLTYLFRSMGFIERLAASIAISAALLGISSYYLGIIGVHINYSSIILPAAFVLPSVAIMLGKSKKIDNNAP